MVGVARIELATPAMSTQCSTTELHAHAVMAPSRALCAAQGVRSRDGEEFLAAGLAQLLGAKFAECVELLDDRLL